MSDEKMQSSDSTAKILANGSDPVQINPVHMALLLKSTWRKLDRVEKSLAELMERLG